MNVLIVGGAGKVGSILRPALEARYACSYLDLRPVTGAEDRTTIGNVNEPDAILAARCGIQAVGYLAMGVGSRPLDVGDVNAAFEVNAKGVYRVYTAALGMGVRRFVHASTLSVYETVDNRGSMLDESIAPDAWHTYGLTKRMGEMVCETAALHYRDAGVVALRLMSPAGEQEFKGNEYRPGQSWYLLGPDDTRRLFVAALEHTAKPGYIVVQATGDMAQTLWPHARATELLGWRPLNQ
jgi:nucleoside-diphosphate-sugar epimerase